MPNGKKSWGLGGPRLVKPYQGGKYEVVVGLFDLHMHHHEYNLWRKTLKVIEEIQPNRVIYGGDVADNALISRWEEKKRKGMPQGKVARMVDGDLRAIGFEIFGAIRQIAPNAIIDFCEGNHDERARNWYDDDLESGIEHFKEAMLMNKYDVNWHSRAGMKLREEFIVKHGNYTTMHNAKKEYETTRCGGWSGHKHAWTMWDEPRPETNRRWNWTVAPVMCRLDYDYGPGNAGKASWPQGFLVGTFSTEDQYHYHTDVAHYWRGRLMFRGKVY